MLDWQSIFFGYGHTIEYIENMSYWDYLEIIHARSNIDEKKGNTSSGKKFRSGGKLTDTMKKAIANRKKLEGK